MNILYVDIMAHLQPTTFSCTGCYATIELGL